MNPADYELVTLAAFLHDIGKLLQRVPDREEVRQRFPAKNYQYAEGKHGEVGAEYVKGPEFQRLLRDGWGAEEETIELAAKLVRRHERPLRPPDEPMLNLLVQQADSCASKERGPSGSKETDRPKKGPYNPLFSIFTRIDIGKKKPNQEWGYELGPLNALECFPVEDKTRLGEDEMPNLVAEFRDELETAAAYGQPEFNKFFNTLCAIAEKYLWCVPGDTVGLDADISLFDHLRLASAIAACLYRYHDESGTLINISGSGNQEQVKNQELYKFRLMAGDLSGIQDYLYDIAWVTGEGGVAKRLRARSFYLSAVVEVTIQKLLKALNLPQTCVLVSAAGFFVILVPNTPCTLQQLEAERKEVEAFFRETFAGELSLTLNWDTELCGRDFHQGSFGERFADMKSHLETAKYRKFQTQLQTENGWNEGAFVLTKHYDAYYNPPQTASEGESIRTCRSCQKFPALHFDPDEEMHGEAEERKFCAQCYEQKVLGRHLLDAQYIAISPDTGSLQAMPDKRYEWQTLCFYNNTWFATVLANSEDWKRYHDKGIQYTVFQRIRDRKAESLSSPLMGEGPGVRVDGAEQEVMVFGMVYRFLANWVPRFAKENFDEHGTLCQRCDRYALREGENQCDHAKDTRRALAQPHTDRYLQSFHCIAAESSRHTPASEQLLGYLKADIDNLGKIFRVGLGDRLTASRYLTMSRMLDLFFSGWMYRILEDEKKFHSLYTVYSGGDDLFVVGPWETVIDFAFYLRERFEQFVCQNENITLSAAVLIAKPRYPIARAAADVKEWLEKAKDDDEKKNRIALFGGILEWNTYRELGIGAYADMLDSELKDEDSPMSVAFLHRLLEYWQMYQLSKQEGNPRGLLYRSHLAYDIERNILQKKRLDSGQVIVLNRELQESLWRLFDDRRFDEGLMNYLNIPVSICLYRNRRKKEEE